MIGARLKQARLLAGMTQRELASALGESGLKITAAAISEYERQQRNPSAEFLLSASEILDVPSTYFLHEPSKEIDWLAFRCRKRLSKGERNRIKAYATDRAALHIELRELLYPNSTPDLPQLRVNTLADAESAAEHLRQHWDVGDRPLDNLVQTAEDRDVVVIEWHDETGLFDGLSGRCDSHPIAVINTNVPSDRKRLSLAHEIGHLVMKVDEQCKEKEEHLAYRFAAALLVPAAHAFRELKIKRKNLSWGELESLKRKYGMSISAWVRRARDLEIVNHSTYASMNRFIKSNYWHRNEPGSYLGDEEPLLLRQMAQHAVSEGLINVDRVSLVSENLLLDEDELIRSSEYPSATELLEMDDEEREDWMSKMFQLAEDMEFEEFEAFGEEDF